MNAKRIASDDYGFGLVEALIAIVILGIVIVPMMGAFDPAMRSIAGGERLAVFTNQARSTLNRAVALDYDAVDGNQGSSVDLASLFGSDAEAAKESFAFEGIDYTPTISITDASSGDGGLLEIMVTIEETTLKTLKAEY
jgi:type II secretory pathway pseudopilin PulG